MLGEGALGDETGRVGTMDLELGLEDVLGSRHVVDAVSVDVNVPQPRRQAVSHGRRAVSVGVVGQRVLSAGMVVVLDVLVFGTTERYWESCT